MHPARGGSPFTRPQPDRRRSTAAAVLLADDNEDVRALWRIALTLSGFVVREAVNGADAVASARERLPDVILLDFCMPIMDGAEAVRALKGEPQTADTPVIGLTAHAQCSTTAAFLRACDMVLEKPVCPEALVAAVGYALRRSSPMEMGGAHTTRGL